MKGADYLECLLTKGKQRIKGEVRVNGAKNAAVAILPASLLTEGTVKIDNLPKITDISRLVEILKALGARVTFSEERCIYIDSSDIHNSSPPPSLVNTFRASYYLMGVLLGRFGKVEIPMPGGCDLGPLSREN